MSENVATAQKQRIVGITHSAYMTKYRNGKIKNILADGCALSAVDLLVNCAESGDMSYKDMIDKRLSVTYSVNI